MRVYVNIVNICGGNVNCYRPVAVFNCFRWHMGRYVSGIKYLVTSVTHIEDQERHLSEDDLCENNKKDE